MSNEQHFDTAPKKTAEDAAQEFNEPPVAGKVVDKVDEHTPVNPAPVQSAVDPSDGREKTKPLEEMVHALAQTVDTLANTVGSLVKDERVVNRIPWTHRGSRNV